MLFTPFWYQQDGVDAALSWVKKCCDPCIIQAPTASGKSYMVAMLAKAIHEMSGKKILCLAPNKTLIRQNHEKYLHTGEPASIFCSSAGRKETKNFVVFGSPLTVWNSIEKFGSQYAAVIVDEPHMITDKIIEIIEEIRKKNPLLRVIGLDATPHRLGTGYIYRNHYKTGYVPEGQAIDPFFSQLVYEIDARVLIAEGRLCQPIFNPVEFAYETSKLKLGKDGEFTKSSVDKAFVGQGRKTARIVEDIIKNSADKKGVMIFAATVQHAREIMESLPPEISGLAVGDVGTKECDRVFADFKAKKIKYFVSVGKATTGFDCTHVDHIAIMRACESAALIQQIIGRGLRVELYKLFCLISDYGGNIERHNIFLPLISWIAFASMATM